MTRFPRVSVRAVCFRLAWAAAAFALAGPVRAQDWTATMPPVEKVLQAVDDYVQTREFTGQHRGDPDFVASAQIGTLRSLRRLMIDVSGIQDMQLMSVRMRAQTERYLWAELGAVALVQQRFRSGGGGWMAATCRNPASNHRRVFRQSPDRCLLDLLYVNSGSYEHSYGYHREIWPVLFPAATAAGYVELTRSKALVTPVIDKVLQHMSDQVELPSGVAPPKHAQCADWKSYRWGAELCQLIATPATCKYLVNGPYASPELAIRAIEPDVRKATDDFNASVQGVVINLYAEVGGWVVHRRGSPMNSEFYLTVPVRGAAGISDINTTGEDYKRSLLSSFTGDCDFYETFDLIAMYHSHPDFTDLVNSTFVDNNEFSDNDWQAAHEMFQRKTMRAPADGAPVESSGDIRFRIQALRNFLGFYLLRPDRCIDFIDGTSASADPGKVEPIDAPACPLGRRRR